MKVNTALSRVILLGLFVAGLSTPAFGEKCFTATIDGTQSGTGSTAIGSATFILSDDETVLTYNITFSGLSAAETAAHIHSDAEGGGVVKNVGLGDPKIGTWTSTDTPPLNATRVTDLINGQMYVNIHSGNFPGGEIRGQILVSACNETCFDATIDGTQSGTGSTATGSGLFSLNHTQTELTYNVTFSGLLAAETAAHIHSDAEGGGVVKNVGLGDPKVGTWSFTDTPPLTPARAADLVAGQMYVNIHSSLHPGGEIRGQMLTTACAPECFIAEVNGTQSGTGSLATGQAYMILNHTETRLDYSVAFTGLSAAETAAHIHNDNEGGAVVKDIGTGMQKQSAWTLADTPPITNARVADLKNGDLYVNIHSSNFPGGEIRGQLGAGPCNTTVSVPSAPTVATRLGQNYPNPFNPSTTIDFTLAERTHVTLRVYDAKGRLVTSLLSGVRNPGPGQETWDGRDDSGRRVASGIYFYRLVAGSAVETRKMVLLK